MPFGEEIGAGVGQRNEVHKYSSLGAGNIRQRFTGYEKDTETQLDFAEVRMYQNKHKWFINISYERQMSKNTKEVCYFNKSNSESELRYQSVTKS